MPKYLLIFFLFFASCVIKNEPHIIKIKTDVNSSESLLLITEYKGWWIYGENEHLFKDEKTLSEWNLVFPKENMEALKALYMSITEMEYFPVECKMFGLLSTVDTTQVLIVSDFDILYIQGCGE